ncbi:MAG: LamG domain-containing protein, partial [Nanoarchaeota archaeon]
MKKYNFGRKGIYDGLPVVLESIMISLFFIFLVILIAEGISAVSFNCSIVSAGSCIGAGNISVFRLMNETNGFWNAHAQNATITSYAPIYNYSVCCSSDETLSITQPCSEATVIKLSNWTNAHVQQGSYSGGSIIYSYSSCLSVEPGTLSCSYSASCSANQVCLASMASSNISTLNQTDAHLGSCTEYSNKICCGVNSPSSISGVVLNSTYGTNYTDENLSVYFAETDVDGDALTNITDWRKQGVSIAVLNMPFNTNVSLNTSGAIKDYSTWSNNGTLGGGISANMPARTTSGKVGGAYVFDGVNDYINITNFSWFKFGTGNFSISFWIKPSSWSGSTTPLSNSVYSSGWDGFHFERSTVGAGCTPDAANYIIFVVAGTSVCSSATLSNNIWYHIVGTRNGSTARVYINNVAGSVTTASGSVSVNRNYLIGRNPDAT